MNQLYFFVPTEHKEQVKEACFEAGGGKYEKYDRCSWETKGIGQFRPLDASNAYIGTKGIIETLEEYRVEMICEDRVLEDVIKALKKAHPYETPAFGVISLKKW